MKKKDVTLILVIVIFSSVFALLLSSLLFGSPDETLQQAEVVAPITSEFELPDEKYYNANSVNPTQIIRIGEDSDENAAPFNPTNDQ